MSLVNLSVNLNVDLNVDISEDGLIEASKMGRIVSLFYAVKNDHLKLAEYLILNGTLVDTKNEHMETPLLCVISQLIRPFYIETNRETKFKMAKLLIKAGADVNYKYEGMSILHRAIKYDKPDVVLFLIENGANINIQDSVGRTPLYFALSNDRFKIAILLLDLDADPNIGDKVGIYPLEMAAQNAELDLILKLISKTKDVNLLGKKSALHYAAKRCKYEVVEKLIEKGALLDAKDKNGKIPLHYICNTYNDAPDGVLSLQIAKLLVEKGSSINVKDKEGNTPLHVATWRRKIDIAKILIDFGADINLKNNNGNKPMDFIFGELQSSIMEYINDDSIFIKGAQ